MAIRVDNIFDLVGRFGAEEDRLTASFGFLLKNDARLFRAFMAEVGVTVASPASYDLLTQSFYPGFEEDNRIDLEISATFDLTCLVESKIGGNRFDGRQLERYAQLLEDRRARRDMVRLVLITHLDESERFRQFASASGLPKEECRYMRWTEICDIVRSHSSPRIKLLRDQFLHKVGRAMSDRKIIDELPVGDVREVMIVTVNPENARLALEQHLYRCQNEKPRRQEARYIAFYETRGPKAIRYIARVLQTEINVQVEDWLAKDYTLEEPVPLVRPIPKGQRPARFAVRYATFEKLINAETLDDVIHKQRTACPSMTS
jgi:hypothetical protein